MGNIFIADLKLWTKIYLPRFITQIFYPQRFLTYLRIHFQIFFNNLNKPKT